MEIIGVTTAVVNLTAAVVLLVTAIAAWRNRN